MNKRQFTASLHLKGWRVKDALERWGRSQDWYHDNCSGNTEAKTRLTDMINGLPDKNKGK